MRVNRLDGPLLNYWVAKSQGLRRLSEKPAPGETYDPADGWWHPEIYQPASNWAQGGPIVSNEWYELETILTVWFGPNWPFVKAIADDPLSWMMRAYVATQFGDEVEEVAAAEFDIEVTAEEPDFQPAFAARRWSSWFGRGKAPKADHGY